MGDSLKGGAPLEFFLWQRGDKAKPTATSERTVQGHSGDENLIGDALRVFNSRTRTVQRSSGGASVAEPYQIVFLESKEPNSQKPEVRIKVRFKDFKLTRNGELTTGELITHTKVVLPSELGEALSYDLEAKQGQTFVADFGMGIIPIYVIAFRTESSNTPVAYFIETGDLHRLMSRDAGGACSIQMYRVDQDVIRHAEAKRNGGGKSEWDVARENYSERKRAGAVVIPPQLACGSPVHLSSGKTPRDVRMLLEKSIRLIETPDTAIVARQINTGEMVPFGVFER